MISIIIPVYNTPVCFLKLCVHSALAQTVTEKEVVIVNDGSTSDETVQYLNGLVSVEKETLRVIHTDNQGVSSARYTGIQEARGEYVVFLDADDAMNVQLCERLLELLCSGEYDMAEIAAKEVLDLTTVDIEEDVAEEESHCISGTANLEKSMIESCGRPINWAPWGKIFRRSLLLETYQVHHGIYRGQDVVTLAEYLTVCHSVVCAEDPLYYYNKGNDGSTTKNLTWKTLTIADCWVAVYNVQKEAQCIEAMEIAGVLAAEALIGAVVHAKRRNATDRIPHYSRLLREFRGYRKKLSRKNKIKLDIILYIPWFYRFWK